MQSFTQATGANGAYDAVQPTGHTQNDGGGTWSEGCVRRRARLVSYASNGAGRTHGCACVCGLGRAQSRHGSAVSQDRKNCSVAHLHRWRRARWPARAGSRRKTACSVPLFRLMVDPKKARRPGKSKTKKGRRCEIVSMRVTLELDQIRSYLESVRACISWRRREKSTTVLGALSL
jgi:hypothetical protein